MDLELSRGLLALVPTTQTKKKKAKALFKAEVSTEIFYLKEFLTREH